MQKHLKKALSVMLCVVLLATTLIAVIPEMVPEAGAVTYRTAKNGASASYKASKYYEHFTRIELTGDGVTDTLAVALSQLGYHEGASTSDMDGISSSNGNFTEYNYNMGNQYTGGYNYEWCACFMSWSLYQARQTDHGSGGTSNTLCRYNAGNANYIWREIGCPSWVSNLKSAGRWKARSSGYKPQSGDLIFFRSAAHIGMVVYSDSNYVYTIEGNTSDQAGIEPAGGGVFFKSYALSNTGIDGYGVLPYKTNSSVPKIDYSGANPTTGLYISNAVKYVYSTATGSTVTTNMPRFTMFEVTEIASNGRLKATYTTSSGTTVTGWILNSSDRVIQLTTTKKNSLNLLNDAIAAAEKVRYDHYTEANLATLRSVYAEAIALKNNSSASDASLDAMTAKLQNAINNTVASNEKVVSVGKSYTAPDGGRTDKWADDGKRLTDGTKGTTDGGAESFSGFNTEVPIEVVIDLGGNVSSNAYRIYTAKQEGWGISCPTQVEVSVSNDGKTFTSIGSTTVRNRTYASDTWNMFTMTVNSKTTRTERYIKFTITNGSTHIWLEEVQVMNNPVAATGKVYVTGMNGYIRGGDTIIYTPDQGTISVKDHNITYTGNIVATWDGSNYVITSITSGSGADTPSITLQSNQILIATHSWEEGTDDPVLGSHENYQRLKNASVGAKLVFTNVDINGKLLGIAPTIEIIGAPSAPVDVPDNAEPFWVTHLNNNSVEGAGTIFTSQYEGAAWWLHVAFAPTGSNGTYKIVDISNGLSDGKATALTVPAGGFVWAINKGNNYIELGTGDVDYTSENCNEALALAEQWQIGDEFTFYGIDPLSPVVNTSTPATNWYDDAYVCQSYYVRKSNAPVNPPVDTEGKLGDVNNDGAIDQYDYILVKRHYFETRTLTADEMTRANVNKDAVVDQFDYILIARHYFGTFEIK